VRARQGKDQDDPRGGERPSAGLTPQTRPASPAFALLSTR
jgi:hypothetical protein